MKKIVVLPGGFHPFHAGHLALYKQALAKFKDADVYMAASDNQKERPFPFRVKQLLATEVAGIPKNRFVQVSGSPFQPDAITDNYTSTEDALIFVRSDKDRKTHPLPDQIRKSDGKMGYYISYPLGKDPALEPFADHAYIDYLDVVPFAGGMTSATEIRNAWPKLDELGKIELIKGMYPKEEMTVPKVKKISQILDSVLMGELVESFVSPDQLDEGLKQQVIGGLIALGMQFGSQVNAEEVFIYQDNQGKMITVDSKEDVPSTSEMVYYVDFIDSYDEEGNKTTSTGEKKWLRFPANLSASDAKWFLKNLPQPQPEFVRKAMDQMRDISESFVDPDESKQYWNHDAQKVGVGMMIDMPLTDKPNLNGRRQGFNEGEERSIIRDAAINALVNAFEGHENDCKHCGGYGGFKDKRFARGQKECEKCEGTGQINSREALEANIYSELSRLNVEDIVDPEMDHHGQRMGNFASGRVIDVVDSSSVIDEVMQQINYFDPADDRNYVSESLNKIRGMIKETTDEQKSKSVHLHRKLFELMEEEKKNNVVKLRGFGREVDKPIPDLNRVRAEKEKEQERENNRYSERRAEQEELLARLQAELLNAKQEFSELADAQLLPIEMLDTMESITKLIDYIENWEGSEAQNNFPFTESILEKLQLKTVQLKEYFGGMRDTSAPRVLRKQTPKLSPKAFWNTIDLSETADYIEEK